MTSIAFLTTAWGPRYGGMNAFNADLCEAVAGLDDRRVRVLCVVLGALREEVEDAAARGVTLVSLSGSGRFEQAHAYQLMHHARTWGDLGWWIGHDVISGRLAVEVGQLTSLPAAVIDHMDYPSYGTLKGSSGEAVVARDTHHVDTLLQARAVFGVGPKLAEAARNRVRSGETRVVELVPGLASMEPLLTSASTFRAITFGRLDPESNRIKQGTLAVRAFGNLVREVPDVVGLDPRITVMGVEHDDEADLLALASAEAGRSVAVIAHPFTESRETLFQVLRDASVCMMLSVHEGFGLAGWEAIAAEVPLVLSRNSGLHMLLKTYGGPALGCVRSVDIQGAPGDPYHTEHDLRAVTAELRAIAIDRAAAKRDAAALRRMLADCTWERAARSLLDGLGLEGPCSARGGATSMATVTLPASNLPLRTDAYVAQPELLATCEEKLTEGRLLTLVGPGGSGKTRLALELARGLREEFEDHVYFVDLTTVADPNLVVNSITRALEIDVGEPVIEALKELFRGRSALLLLDNFEHVQQAAPVVRDLLTAVPGLKVLATSLWPMDIPGEQAQDVARLTPDQAARLFIDRVAERTTRPPPDDDELRMLCERLDRLPLAIELVAPRARFHTIGELTDMLEQSILDLPALRPYLPERQHSLRAAVEWTYRLLSDSEQGLFRQLSVFSGGCTVQTAAAVLRGSSSNLAFGDEIASLDDKRLLREDPPGSRRFGMLGTLRVYAAERLEEDSEEAERLRQQHAEHFLSLAESDPMPRGPVPGDVIEREQANLAAALRHFVRSVQTERALRLAVPMGRFWWSRDYGEGWRRLAEVLALPCPERLREVRAEVLEVHGRLAIRLGRLDAAAAAFDERLAIAQRISDDAFAAAAIADRALVDMERCEFEAARPRLERALTIYRSAGDAAAGLADALDSLGVIATHQGDYVIAEARLSESLSQYRSVSDPIGEAWVLNDLARLALVQDDLEPAERHASAALAIGHEQSDWGLIAWARNYLGLAASRRGRCEEARQHHGESLQLVILLGDRRPQALALEGFAALAAEEAHWRRAVELAEAADALRHDAGIPRTAAEAVILDRHVERARAALGEDLDAAVASGRAMSPERAVMLARND